MKIIIEQDPITKKVDTKVIAETVDTQVDIFLIIKVLTVALDGAVNKAIELRNQDQKERKIVIPNPSGIRKFGSN